MLFKKWEISAVPNHNAATDRRWDFFFLSSNFARRKASLLHSFTYTFHCYCTGNCSWPSSRSTETIACCKSALLEGTMTVVIKGGQSIPWSHYPSLPRESNQWVWARELWPLYFSCPPTSLLFLSTSNFFYLIPFVVFLDFMVLERFQIRGVLICRYFYNNIIIFYEFLETIDLLCQCSFSYSCQFSATSWIWV